MVKEAFIGRGVHPEENTARAVSIGRVLCSCIVIIMLPHLMGMNFETGYA